MNLFRVFDELENIDPEFYERTDSRRQSLKRFAGFGSRVALSALPLMMSALLNKAYGRITSRMTDVLNFALMLEHLEYRFYDTAVSRTGLLPEKDKISVIRDHERAHVELLRRLIRETNDAPVPERRYDFTGNGAYPNVFSDYQEFLMVAQAFEDTGVGAYKGQAHKLKHNNELLESALRIHSMEARHAAHIRMIRRLNHYSELRPWIIGNDGTQGTNVERIYKKEDRHRQVLINIRHIGGHKEIGYAATSSFDEPLSQANVLEIVNPFMA